VFHIQQQFETLVSLWMRIASGVRSEREALEARLANPRRRCQDHLLVAELGTLRQLEARSSQRADDLRTLAQWLERDIRSLAGPDQAARQALLDFIVDELRQREPDHPYWLTLLGLGPLHAARLIRGATSPPITAAN
jgi:hypothetical protein